MKHCWLNKDNSEHLILFFNGWSCDKHPFTPIKSEAYDVLMLNDYCDLTLPGEVIKLIDCYQKVSVVAWSFGVWVAQIALYPLKDKLEHRIAINGTLQPVDKDFGIPAPIALGTLSGLNYKNLGKFQRRMFSNKEWWQVFQSNQPQRPIEELKNELFLLIEHFKVQKMKYDFYDLALISTNDLIFSASNQKRYWESKTKAVELSTGHFCFYDFKSWDEIITLNNTP